MTTFPTPYGYDVEQVDSPKYISRGEHDLTGTREIEAFMPMQLSSTTLVSGAFGVSGLYRVQQMAVPYADISGMSGCIGITTRKIRKATDTGLRNQNLMNRKLAILHEGYCYMLYQSGTLDGAVVTLRHGDLIAPTISGFRVYQELNVQNCPPSGELLTTGNRQCLLGHYADVASSLTGTWKKVRIMPNNLYGKYP